MNIEILIATMNQTDFSLVKKMNIHSDTIIINQSNKFDYEVKNIENKKIQMYTFNECGVGLSRNNALLRATGDVVVFADDDVVYNDDYEEIIKEQFRIHKDADMILFNLPSTNEKRPTAKITKNRKVNIFSCMKFGAVNIAARKDFIINNNITFSLLFGGGAKYSSGEDSLFIYDILKNGGNVYTSTFEIGKVLQTDSSWFKGFNEKYFFDKGVFFYCMSKKFYLFWCIQFIIRHKKICSKLGIFKVFNLMLDGVKEIKKRG